MFDRLCRFASILPATWFICSSAAVAQNASMGPQGSAPDLVQTVNTAGTVRINCLVNLESFLMSIVNSGEIVFILVGSYLFIKAFLLPCSRVIRVRKIAIALLFCATGFALPVILDWSVATAQDLTLFS